MRADMDVSPDTSPKDIRVSAHAVGRRNVYDQGLTLDMS